MPERRQAFRRDAIEVWLSEDEKDFISVAPIPWENRNDFGNELIRQHVEITNEAVRLWIDPETSAPQLEAKLGEKFTDARRLLELGLPQEAFAKIKDRQLYSNQIVALLLAVCDVNELQLGLLIDPNSPTPTVIGSSLSGLVAAQAQLTARIESGLDSSSQESLENESESSPTQNLPESLTSTP